MYIRIDPHVHCRDGNEAYKETIAHVFDVAKKQGVTKIFDMPEQIRRFYHRQML